VANNVVPDRCLVTVNRRLAPGVEPDVVIAELRTLCPEVVDVREVSCSMGAHPNLEHRLVAEFVAATDAPVRPKLGWTDVARFAAWGVPALNYGPGDPTVAHTAEEFVELHDLDAVYAGLAAFLGL
jgi:succinyl-diaminopimelate desuccinylase